MAAFNEILAGRFNRFVQKHFSMKGREGMPTLSADMVMGMNFFSGEENRGLQGWNLYGFNLVGAAPGAGNFLTAELRNPPTSGVIAVATVVKVGSPTAAAVLGLTIFRGATGDQNTVSTPFAIDGRTQGNSSLILTNNSAAQSAFGGTGQTIINVNLPAVTSDAFLIGLGAAPEIPLLPGDALGVGVSPANTGVTYALWWRERVLEDSEKRV